MRRTHIHHGAGSACQPDQELHLEAVPRSDAFRSLHQCGLPGALPRRTWGSPEIPQGNAIRQNKEESTKVDESDDWSNGEQKSARVALVDEVLDWSGAPKEEAVGGILKMLSFRELPTDGTADDMDLGLILMHIRESRVIGVTYADAMDDLEIFFAEADKDESPNENDMKLEEAIEF